MHYQDLSVRSLRSSGYRNVSLRRVGLLLISHHERYVDFVADAQLRQAISTMKGLWFASSPRGKKKNGFRTLGGSSREWILRSARVGFGLAARHYISIQMKL